MWVNLRRRTKSISYINSCRSFLRRRFQSFQALMRHCPQCGQLPTSSNSLYSRPSPSTEKTSGTRQTRRSNRQNDKEGDAPEKRGGSSRIPTSSDANGQGLACPFYKKDPRRYWKCARFRSNRISHVKQHIYRSHKQPPAYCTFCGSTFADPGSRDRHVAAGCVPQPHNEPDGITLFHRQMLADRVPPHLTITEQWFVVFDIVCPGQAHPLSPYHDSEVSEVVFTDLREFVTSTSGTNIVFSGLSQSVALGPQIEASLREALSRGLGNLIDGWVMRRSVSPGAVIIDNLPDASSSPFTTPFASNEPEPPAQSDTRHGTASASPHTFLQPPIVAIQDASYLSEAPQNSTSLQDDSILYTSLEVDLLVSEIDDYALPDPEDWVGSVLPEGSINDEGWWDGSVDDAGYDPAAHQ